MQIPALGLVGLIAGASVSGCIAGVVLANLPFSSYVNDPERMITLRNECLHGMTDYPYIVFRQCSEFAERYSRVATTK